MEEIDNMLKTLTVWNFALLKQAQVEFSTGLNILTGETGAGKSILIDALSAVLGCKISSNMIGHGADWLRVEAVFLLNKKAKLREYLISQAVDCDDDTLIITRQISRNGRNMILINGCHVTLTSLRQISAFLVDIHRQNENLALLHENNQLALLDNKNAKIVVKYQAAYHEWKELKSLILMKEKDATDVGQKLDMLKWQEQEISNANLQEDEEIALQDKIKRLSNVEKISDLLQKAYSLLDGGAKECPQGIIASVSIVKDNLISLQRYDETLHQSTEIAEEAYSQLQDIVYRLRDYKEMLDFEPYELDKLQNRMDIIYKLQKKYGATVKDILLYLQKIKSELADIENYDDDIKGLYNRLSIKEVQLSGAAKDLTKVRKKEAHDIAVAVEQKLHYLGMPDAKFNIQLLPLEDYQLNGKDIINILFSANAGTNIQPLEKVASGGELSRIALAIKTVIADTELFPDTMVFDEIDTGIGGRTAQIVAECIDDVATDKQVLCITHLPQIACMADKHIYISKAKKGIETITNIKTLSLGERINEIARMASGSDVTTASLDNAREMIDNALLHKKRNTEDQSNHV